MSNQLTLTTRSQVALEIFKGIIAGDWKFEVKDRTWDDVAIERAYDIADKFLKAGEEQCH